MQRQEPAFRVDVLGGIQAHCARRSDRARRLAAVAAVLALLVLARHEPVGAAELTSWVWGDEPPPSAGNQVQRLVGQLRRLFEPDLHAARRPAGVIARFGDAYRFGRRRRRATCSTSTPASSTTRPRWSPAGRAPDSSGSCTTIRGTSPWNGSGSPWRCGPWTPDGTEGAPSAEVLDRAWPRWPTPVPPRRDPAGRADPALSVAPAGASEASRRSTTRSAEALRRRARARARSGAASQRTASVLRDEPDVSRGAVRRRPGPAAPRGRRPRAPAGRAQDVLDRIAADGEADGRDHRPRRHGRRRQDRSRCALGPRGRGRFPDGQLYVNLRGFDPGGHPMPPPRRCAASWARSACPKRSPADGPRSRPFRSRLTGRRLLILLDNAADAGQVRPLLPAGRAAWSWSPAATRSPGWSPPRAPPLRLETLPADEARDLLIRRLGARRRCAPNPAATVDRAGHRLSRACRLALVAGGDPHRGRAVRGPSAGVARELELGGARPRGRTRRRRSDRCRAVFAWSYDALGPRGRPRVPAAGRPPRTRISRSSAASLLGADAATGAQAAAPSSAT